MDLYLGFAFFSCAKAYKQLTGHAFAPPPFKWLWQNRCQHKHKVFFWFLLKDRLSTRDLLRPKGMELQSNECVLCTQHIDETSEHLFLLCPMAIQFWNSIGLIIPAFNNCTEVMMSFRRQLNLPFFMEIIILGCWGI